ncbi:MAG: TPM domain-containing protein [Planctomycetes bacterium]|nr:TPM domain-containing protein [Planctomycetota bacterium]
MRAFQELAAERVGAQALWDDPWLRALEAFERVGPWILVAATLGLAVVALVRGRRLSISGVMGSDAQRRVHAALVEAERRTVGEIVPVVLGRSDAHPAAEWRSGLVMLLAGSALLEGLLPWHAPWLVLTIQLALGSAGFALARWIPGWKRLFVTRRRASEVCAEQAGLEFQRLELHRTEARTGVLVLVSLFERRVVVLGDVGIHATVGDAHWQRTRDAVLAGVDRGDLAGGLVEGIQACGELLARHFPAPDGSRNEVPDRLVVRAE